jgi:hypothetical protein
MSLTVILIGITVLISFWGWKQPDIQSKLMHTP